MVVCFQEAYKDTPEYDIELVRKLLAKDRYKFRPKAEDYVMCEVGAAVQEACDIIKGLSDADFDHSELSKNLSPPGHWMDVYHASDPVYGELYIKFMVVGGKSVYIISFWFWDDGGGD